MFKSCSAALGAFSLQNLTQTLNQYSNIMRNTFVCSLTQKQMRNSVMLIYLCSFSTEISSGMFSLAKVKNWRQGISIAPVNVQLQL